MITYWSTSHGLFTIQEYLAQRGAELKPRFTAASYDRLMNRQQVSRTVHILSALDQITPSQFDLVRGMAEQLDRVGPGRILNHPSRVLFREFLLHKLAEVGLNDFHVHQASHWEKVDRFPVFVRDRDDHNGNLSRLLESSRELGRAIASLRLRGHSLKSLLIVEFCDTADRQGRFRKYAALKIGDRIIPVHIMVGTHWMVKSVSNEPVEDVAQEELAFVEDNPHADWLRTVFDLAGVDYGRIDYGIRNGRPQVWEVNLNPTLQGRLGHHRRNTAPPEVTAIRDASREVAHDNLRQAFAALDRDDAEEPELQLELDVRRVTRAQHELRVRDRRANLLAFLTRFSRRPWAGAPIRKFLHRFSPR